jgi:tetratricopeptide (TPR) repeat protein
MTTLATNDCLDTKTENTRPANSKATPQNAVSEEALSQLSLRIEDCFAPSPEDVAAWRKELPPAEVAMCEEGLAAIDRMIAKVPDDARHWFNRAHFLGALRRYDEAMKCFTRSVTIEPRNIEMLTKTITFCALRGKHEEAIRFGNDLIDVLRHSLLWALIRQGESLNVLGRQDEVLWCWNEVFKTHPGSVFVTIWKCHTLLKLGRGDEAMHCISTARQALPDQEHLMITEGEILTVCGRHEDALRAWNEIIAKRVAGSRALRWKAKVLQNLARTDEATTCLREAQKMDEERAAAAKREAARFEKKKPSSKSRKHGKARKA